MNPFILITPTDDNGQYLRYRMFEEHMDDYLDEEIESVKGQLDVVCDGWEHKVGFLPQVISTSILTESTKLSDQSQVRTAENAAQFLGSHNPALLKRNVLASFTNVLLLPVTIVPRTVGALVTTSSSAAVNGISMLNPQRWGAPAPTGYSSPLNSKDNDYYMDERDQYDEVTKNDRPGMQMP